MAGLSLREALDQLVADVVPRHDAPGRDIVRRARQRSHRRHVLAAFVSMAFTGLLAVTWVVGWAPSTIVPSTGKHAAPQVVVITCTARGTTAQPAEVAASPDGVHLRVVSNARAAAEVDYRLRSDAPWNPAEPVITPPPGTIELSCSHQADRTRDAPVALRVVDPHHYWSAGVFPPFSCELTPVPAGAAPAAVGADPHAAGQSLARSQGLYLGQRQSGYAEHSPVYFLEMQDQMPSHAGLVPVGIIKSTSMTNSQWLATVTQQCSS
jgi:hypothetical protein